MKKSLKRKKDTDCIATELCMGVHHCETLCSGDGQVFLCVCVLLLFFLGGKDLRGKMIVLATEMVKDY